MRAPEGGDIATYWGDFFNAFASYHTAWPVPSRLQCLINQLRLVALSVFVFALLFASRGPELRAHVPLIVPSLAVQDVSLFSFPAQLSIRPADHAASVVVATSSSSGFGLIEGEEKRGIAPKPAEKPCFPRSSLAGGRKASHPLQLQGCG